MPNMNGLDAAKAIRALPEGRHIPIIALTARAFLQDIQATRQAGMNAHIPKPLNLPLLQQTLLRLCRGEE